MTRRIRTYAEVDDPAGAEVLDQVVAQRERLRSRLARIGAVVPVASGKGGVGKSAVTANLATVLAARGRRVGALDADLNGPSLARMLGVTGASLADGEDGMEPPAGDHGVRVVSMELLQDRPDAPLRWREPDGSSWLWQSSLEGSALREFLSDVAWGDLDVLLVDVPPGVDKIGRLVALVPEVGPFLLVTTPSEMARAVVARSVRLVREAGIETPALVANMTAAECPACGHRTRAQHADGRDGATRLAEETGLETWARIPFDPVLAAETDHGRPPAATDPDGPAGRAFAELADRVERALDARRDGRVAR